MGRDTDSDAVTTCDECDNPATCVMVTTTNSWQSVENGLGLTERCYYACDDHCDHPWCELIHDE
jgi:hypothetical protein